MKKTMISLTLISLILFVITLAFSLTFPEKSLLLTLAITFGTTFYHFAMRLAVGYIVKMAGDRYRPGAAWFFVGKREESFYRRLKLHKIIRRGIPTYSPEEFDASRGVSALLQSTCRAEIVHEVIMVLSFLPLIMNLFFPSSAYLWTSIMGAVIDLFFVTVQRCNRPRLMRLSVRFK